MNFRKAFYYSNYDEIYLDSAATTKRLIKGVEASNRYYKDFNANVHRGSYPSANQATNAYEKSRESIKNFVHAKMSEQIVFTSGATESINLIANGITQQFISGDTILVLESEHHANFLPWFALAKRLSLKLVPIKLEKAGVFCKKALETALNTINHQTAIVVCAHASNAIGNLYPIRELCQKARQNNAISVIDGTQAVSHFAVDVQDIDCDFYVFSGHKMFAGTGIGVLYGKYHLLEALMPTKLGGEMITSVTWDAYSTQPPPLKFEAGTGNISAVVGLAESVEFLSEHLREIKKHEDALFNYLIESVKPLYKSNIVDVYGNLSKYMAQDDSSDIVDFIPIFSFNVNNVHCYDVASYFSQQLVAVRAGHHCAMPLMQSLDIEGSVRVSLACYNTKSDIDFFLRTLQSLVKSQTQDFHINTNSALSSNIVSNPKINTDCNLDSQANLSINDDSQQLAQKTQKLLQQFEKTQMAIKNAKEWSEKHRQLLLFSKYLPILNEEQRVDLYEIDGCEAKVWLKIDNSNSLSKKSCIKAYSNSKIVRGLLAILIAKYQINPHTDLQQYLLDFGLVQYFSQGRREGITKIIKKLQNFSVNLKTC